MPQKGLTFISDRDARNPGGMHPNAHLWDNGNDPVNELKNVMKGSVKSVIAIWTKQHTQEHPMAMLEDVFIYLFHRYQIEAVSKVVGGLYYSYAVKETDK
jgi:hypothetical protein